MGYSPWAFAFISALYFICTWLIRRRRVSSVPLAGCDGISAKLSFLRDTRSWLEKGQRDYAGRIFRLWTPDGYLHIASSAHLKELNGLGEDHLRVAFTDVLMGQYTDVTMSPMGLRALKEGLAQNLGKLMPIVIDEVVYSLDKEIPACKDWTPVNVYDATTLIAATIGSRIMTGPELGHDPEWIKLLLAYTKDVISCAIWLKGLPHVVRIAVLNFLPPVRRLKGHYATVHRMAIPIMEARKKASCLGTSPPKPNDLMQWISDRAAAEGNTYDVKHQAQLQLSAGLASIWSTSKTCTHNLYDLAYHTEYIEPLRQEIVEVLAEEGGRLTKQGLAKMKKLDSFMKESQRVNPAGFVTWDRQALRPLNLKDGTHIPKGTYLALPVADTSSSQSLISDPETFDPWRFHKLRSRSAEDADRYQFTSTDVRYSHFGYGKHSCPGRFFAGQQIKATLALIIRDFDIRLPDGVKQRPANWVYGLHAVPDPKVEILFKRR